MCRGGGRAQRVECMCAVGKDLAVPAQEWPTMDWSQQRQRRWMANAKGRVEAWPQPPDVPSQTDGASRARCCPPPL